MVMIRSTSHICISAPRTNNPISRNNFKIFILIISKYLVQTETEIRNEIVEIQMKPLVGNCSKQFTYNPKNLIGLGSQVSSVVVLKVGTDKATIRPTNTKANRKKWRKWSAKKRMKLYVVLRGRTQLVDLSTTTSDYVIGLDWIPLHSSQRLLCISTARQSASQSHPSRRLKLLNKCIAPWWGLLIMLILYILKSCDEIHFFGIQMVVNRRFKL